MCRSTFAMAATAALLSLLQGTSMGAPPQLQLAIELAEEQDWEACLVESQRIVARGGSNADEALFLIEEAQAHDGSFGPRSILSRIGALPVRAMVAFYRGVVAPALGARCSLQPSCSAYSLQAAMERGWLGLPMTADRLIREPSVVVEGKSRFFDDQRRSRYPDPVSDHIGKCPSHCNQEQRTYP